MNRPLHADAAGSSERLLVAPLRRLLQWGPDADGRVVLLAAIALYVAVIAAGRRVWGVDLWPLLGVPSGPSLFFDARNLTSAWECQRLGYDPLYESPCDPQGRPLMYLRPWLLLGVFGLGQSHTLVLSVVLVGAMFLTFSALVERVPAGTGIVLAIAACSPAVMFAVERANMDIALFSVVALSVLLWRAFPSPARVLSPVLVLLAATAKLYPVFALPAFVIARSRLASRAALSSMTVFVLYLLYSRRDVAHVAEIATQGEHFSYGSRILLAHLYHQVGADRWAGPAALKQLLAVVPIGAIAAVIAVRIHRRMAAPPDAAIARPSLVAFNAGAFIFLGTFAIANNFDYRLTFLLLTLPQLVAWVRSPGHRLSSLAGATLVMTLVLLWVGALSQSLHLWDELASWAVACLLIATVAATLPRLDAARGTTSGRSAPDGPMARGAS